MQKKTESAPIFDRESTASLVLSKGQKEIVTQEQQMTEGDEGP